MRLFVSEYLTSGAWPDLESAPSLLKEGRSMAVALLRDCAALPGCQVCSTWDARLQTPDIPGVEFAAAESPQHEAELFDRLSADCDGTLVIAPECDGILTGRVRRVAAVGGHWLGCSDEAIALCSDKFALSHFLRACDIPVIESSLIPADDRQLPFDFPIVVKPVDGAGTDGVQRLGTTAEFDAFRERLHSRNPNGDSLPGESHPGWIVQPFVTGIPVSMAAIIDGRTGQVETTLLAEQRLAVEDCGRIHYLGGRMPVFRQSDGPARELVKRACGAIPGLSGYVGFDMILADGDPRRPVLVEINPRLTTSYLGYSRIFGREFASRMLTASGFGIGSDNFPQWPSSERAFSSADAFWQNETLCYTAAGEISREDLHGD